MIFRDFYRVSAVAAVSGGVLAVFGNLLHPRYDLDNPELYRQVAVSDRFLVADLLILLALFLFVAGLAAVARSLGHGPGSTAAWYARIAVLVGGTMAIAQTALELAAFKPAAENFASIDDQNQVGAFWATNAIDRINLGLFDVWTLVLLGLAPVLLGVAGWMSQARPRWLSGMALVGGCLAVVIATANLLQSDQGVLESAFLAASLLITAWIICEGVVLWQRSSELTPVSVHANHD